MLDDVRCFAGEKERDQFVGIVFLAEILDAHVRVELHVKIQILLQRRIGHRTDRTSGIHRDDHLFLGAARHRHERHRR